MTESAYFLHGWDIRTRTGTVPACTEARAATQKSYMKASCCYMLIHNVRSVTPVSQSFSSRSPRAQHTIVSKDGSEPLGQHKSSLAQLSTDSISLVWSVSPSTHRVASLVLAALYYRAGL